MDSLFSTKIFKETFFIRRRFSQFEKCTNLSSFNILGNDVGAVDVDHVEATANDQASLMEVLSMPLAQGGVQAGILHKKNNDNNKITINSCF